MTDGRRYYLTPGVISKTKYDEAEVRREELRKRAEGCRQELRWEIDDSLAKRTRMKPIKR